MKNKLLRTSQMAAIAVTMALGAPVYAQDEGGGEEKFSKFYVGAHIGNLEIGGWCRSALGVGLAKCEDTQVALGVIGGYQIFDSLAIEFGGLWADGYDTNGRVTTGNNNLLGVSGGTLVDFSANNEITSYSLGLRPGASIDKVSVHGIVGFHFWDVKATGNFRTANGQPTPANSSLSRSHDGTDFYYGIEASFFVTDDLSIRANYTRFKIDEKVGYSRADYLSGALIYSL